MFSERLELDLATVGPSLAGPARPHDRVALHDAKRAYRAALPQILPTDLVPADAGVDPACELCELVDASLDEASAESFPASDSPAAHGPTDKASKPHGPHSHQSASPEISSPLPVTLADGTTCEIDHGHVVIAGLCCLGLD